MIKIRYLLMLVFFVLSPISSIYAGGSHWKVLIEREIDIEFSPEIYMKVLESRDPFLKGCNQITVKLDKSNGFLSRLNSLVSDRKNKTTEAILTLNDKFANQETIYFGYLSGGLMRELDNDCSFSAKHLEIDNSIEKNESVVLALE